MKALIFVISSLLSIPLFSIQEQEINPFELKLKSEKPTSKMVFKSKFQDFGEVNFGEEYIHYFEFTNEGNEVLRIEEVFAGNETSEVFSFSPEVSPGDTGWVRVRFESELSIGKFSEYFFVRSNSGGKKTLSRLHIKYELFEYLAIGGDNVENNDKVNIRKAPRLGSPIVSQLEKGSSCKILGDEIGDYVEKFDDSFWFKVESDGKIGWVLSALTEF